MRPSRVELGEGEVCREAHGRRRGLIAHRTHAMPARCSLISPSPLSFPLCVCVCVYPALLSSRVKRVSDTVEGRGRKG